MNIIHCTRIAAGLALFSAIFTSPMSIGSPTATENQNDFVVTLLGTGGPNPTTKRFGPSTLVQAGGKNLVFDAGRGALQRIKQLGIVPADIDHIFLTHYHSDHTIGLPDLWLIPWLPPQGRREIPVNITGPTGVTQLTNGLTTAYADDHRIRIADAGLDPKGVEWNVNEFSTDGVVYDVDGVKVTAFEVNHGEFLKPAYGYKIEYNSRSVLISGDTKKDVNVIKYGTGADLIVHEVAMASKKASELKPIEIILAHHTSPQEAGEVFSETKPQMAVFTHFILLGRGPADLPTAEDVLQATRETYDGALTAGEDLMQFTIGDTVRVSSAIK